MISIHAPQWGATKPSEAQIGRECISIHAPQWGATSGTYVFEPIAPDFNPRTPVGCDTVRRWPSPHGSISIHAPQWGATHLGPQSGLVAHISIHAPQWGATVGRKLHRVIRQFQSTHPSGVRPCRRTASGASTDFNPRTPVGCDERSLRQGRQGRHFNPRTPVGCDSWTSRGSSRRGHFNPRTPVGVRPDGDNEGTRFRDISIHAPQWGATELERRLPVQVMISIHAPQWGATGVQRAVGIVQRFQSTHPSGVRHSK